MSDQSLLPSLVTTLYPIASMTVTANCSRASGGVAVATAPPGPALQRKVFTTITVRSSAYIPTQHGKISRGHPGETNRATGKILWIQERPLLVRACFPP